MPYRMEDIANKRKNTKFYIFNSMSSFFANHFSESSITIERI